MVFQRGLEQLAGGDQVGQASHHADVVQLLALERVALALWMEDGRAAASHAQRRQSLAQGLAVLHKEKSGKVERNMGEKQIWERWDKGEGERKWEGSKSAAKHELIINKCVERMVGRDRQLKTYSWRVGS